MALSLKQSLNSGFFNHFLRVKWAPTVVCGRRDVSNSAKFALKPYKFHRLDESPKLETVLTRDDALLMYREMVTIRRMEAAANSLYKEKAIRGFCHLYTGQEAVGVGIEHGLRKNDAVITGYRCHGIAYLRGLSVESIMSELTGRRTGCARGKGGSMHMYNYNFFGGNGIVGAQVPLGAGVAFAQQYLNNDGVTVALYGDGAANQGQCFETYNMAKLRNLPVIFACENNHYGMGTPAARASACTDYYTRGDYVPGLWVDGMDLLSVREAVRFLAEKCREGKGPFVLELETYRYVGHSMSDPGTSYRTREEVQEVRQSRDSIAHLKEKCLTTDLAKAEEFDAIDADVKKIVADAVRIAKTEPELELKELFGDIYVKPLVSKIRGLTPFTEHTHLAVAKPINIKL